MTTPGPDTMALDVTGAVQQSGGLALKVEPWCTPNALGVCVGDIMFGAVESQNLGERPYLKVDLNSNTAPTATPYRPSLREGLVSNELCANPVTTDNIPNGVIDGDAAVELFNSSPSALDLADYRLCVNDTCLWLEGSVQPFGCKVYYRNGMG